jgi:hypothetical protein
MKKNIIIKEWETLKKESKMDNPNISLIDTMSCDLIAKLSELTIKGIIEIEGVPIDLLKDRVWWVIEKHNLLPEYEEEEIEEMFEVLDNWEKEGEDEPFEDIDDDKIYGLINI